MNVRTPSLLRCAALAGAALCLSAVAPGSAHAAVVCLQAPYIESGTVAGGCITSESGYSGTSSLQRTGDWGLALDVAGEYRGGSFRSTQAVDLSTGLLRASMVYGSGAEDRSEYQLGNYLDAYDGITFSGSGSAVFTMRLTGAFTGSSHIWYGNTMDTALDLYSETRGDDVLGRINLVHREAGLASFTSGSTCGWTYGLGDVVCEIHSLTADEIDITMHVHVNDITDGERFQFGSRLNTQAYGPRDGGSLFGNTARLSVTLSDGLSFASDSGVLLSAVPDGSPPGGAVPAPSTALLAVLGLLALARSQRRE